MIFTLPVIYPTFVWSRNGERNVAENLRVNYPRRLKKQAFFGYSPPISVDSVYFFVGFLDKNRHSPPISELSSVIIGGRSPPIIWGMNSATPNGGGFIHHAPELFCILKKIHFERAFRYEKFLVMRGSFGSRSGVVRGSFGNRSGAIQESWAPPKDKSFDRCGQ